ncbi:polysaccharide pyruvyl transferase family protein [Chromohalobacter salexigens]|uniref:polysaccharide pyruvyl transferase family protein n=1 Tax=Chromohalobacter israelensis TaxID=141390 RepID=UPI0032E88AB9
MDILITTFPKGSTQNVGDALITESAIKLVQHRAPCYDPVIFFRQEPLESIIKRKVRTILVPGFSVNNNAYPELFSFYHNVCDVLHKILVVGCSFQHSEPRCSTYTSYEYNERTKKFLSLLVESNGPIGCRDEPMRKILSNHNIESIYTGDLALYDDEKIRKNFKRPGRINSVAFTIPHSEKFHSQAKKLLSLIRREFLGASLYVVHHSKANRSSRKLSEFALSLGYIEKDISGTADRLAFYNNIDIHIGYRLHGHVYFLRNRKPSVLMAEDCRSFGISRSGALGVGVFEALGAEHLLVSDLAPYKAMDFLKYSIANNYKEYLKVFKHIDETYFSVVRPYFDMVANKVCLRNQ